jgi:hypothetical protein
LVWEEVPRELRIRLWNLLYQTLFKIIDEQTKNFIANIWDRFFKKEIPPLDLPLNVPAFETIKKISGYPDSRKLLLVIKKEYYSIKWFEVFDFLEFLCEYYPDKDVIKRLIPFLNKILEEEKSAYRIIDGIVVPLTGKEEIKEIEKALNPPDKFVPVREHIKSALKHLSDKKEPNYEDSIRESIHAVESLAKIITGKDRSLSGLIQSLKDIPFNLREGFKELYNWSSKNLRHGKSGKELPAGFEEAIYMMVTCSAFVNYVIAKYGEEKIGEDGNE